MMRPCGLPISQSDGRMPARRKSPSGKSLDRRARPADLLRGLSLQPLNLDRARTDGRMTSGYPISSRSSPVRLVATMVPMSGRCSWSGFRPRGIPPTDRSVREKPAGNARAAGMPSKEITLPVNEINAMPAKTASEGITVSGLQTGSNRPGTNAKQSRLDCAPVAPARWNGGSGLSSPCRAGAVLNHPNEKPGRAGGRALSR
jgi:hypothetical protein